MALVHHDVIFDHEIFFPSRIQNTQITRQVGSHIWRMTAIVLVCVGSCIRNESVAMRANTFPPPLFSQYIKPSVAKVRRTVYKFHLTSQVIMRSTKVRTLQVVFTRAQPGLGLPKNL